MTPGGLSVNEIVTFSKNWDKITKLLRESRYDLSKIKITMIEGERK